MNKKNKAKKRKKRIKDENKGTAPSSYPRNVGMKGRESRKRQQMKDR